MADFVNTIDVLGDDTVIDSIIERTITEFKDDTVTTVGQSAFRECTELALVDLPKATETKGYAFLGCTSLKDVALPNVTVCEYDTFRKCQSLEHAYVPIAKDFFTSVFRGCKALKKLDLPSIKSISGYVFAGAESLVALVIRSPEIATLLNVSAFKYINETSPIAEGTGYIYVPRALLSDTDETKDYRRATNWSTYSAQFRALEDFTVDGTTTGELDETKLAA